MKKRVAILALQGAFIEHEKILQNLDVDTFEIRQRKDADTEFDALIVPGGESTTIGKILRDECLMDVVRERIEKGLPVMGTCAGLILLARNVWESNGLQSENPRIATMDITVRRNAYGRQLGSFNAVETVAGVGDNVPMTFIRAPYIESVGNDVDILARVDGKIVAARQGKQLALSFHPELDNDMRIHKYFLSMIN